MLDIFERQNRKDLSKRRFIWSSDSPSQGSYNVLDTGPCAARPHNAASLFRSAELFRVRDASLPWDRTQPAPLRCHSHHPQPPDSGLGDALPQTRVKADCCC